MFAAQTSVVAAASFLSRLLNITYGLASREAVCRASLLCASECVQMQMQLSGQSGTAETRNSDFDGGFSCL
jgi:hypothetical protein